MITVPTLWLSSRSVSPDRTAADRDASSANVTSRRPSGLDGIELPVLCVCAFAIVALNGRPERLSSGPICLAGALLLLAARIMKNGGRFVAPRRAAPVLLLFLAWSFTAILSTAANFSGEAAVNLLFAYVTPTLLLAAVVGLNPSRRDLEFIVLSLATGALVRFSYAGVIFLKSFGLPSLPALLRAHGQVSRMAPYMDATFGNTGATAALLTPVIAVLCIAWFTSGFGRVGRFLVAAATVVATLNILITGARGAILTLALAILVAVLKLNWRRRIFVGLLLGAVAVAFVANVGSDALGRLIDAATFNAQADDSVRDRLLSIQYGLGMIRANPLGVGPGMTYLYNPYTAAHAFAVEQGSDIGAAGAVPPILLLILLVVRVGAYRPVTGSAARLSFLIGGLAWLVYAMTTDVALNSGVSMPWVGALVLFVGLAEVAPEIAVAPSQVRATARALQRPAFARDALSRRLDQRPLRNA